MMFVPAPTVGFRDVLRVLFRDCDGVIEFRAFRTTGMTGRLFAPLKDLDTISTFWQARRADDLFWGIATRRDNRHGGAWNCVHLPAFFADCDFKLSSEEHVRERLAACSLAPSLVIASGGGLQPYWLFREPADVSTDKNVLRDALRRLASWLDADVVAGEPARILRVPGTLNHKYIPPRLVRVEVFEPDRRYNLTDFDWLPKEPRHATGQPIDLSKPIGEFRNQTLYCLARALKRKRLPDAMLARTVQCVNRDCCAPPLDDREVAQIIRNALTQPDRPVVSFPRLIEVA